MCIIKRQSFYWLRILFAVASTLCEAKLYRTVVEKVNYRVGRYLLFMLLFSAGIWNVSTGVYMSSLSLHVLTCRSLPTILVRFLRKYPCLFLRHGGSVICEQAPHSSCHSTIRNRCHCRLAFLSRHCYSVRA